MCFAESWGFIGNPWTHFGFRNLSVREACVSIRCCNRCPQKHDSAFRHCPGRLFQANSSRPTKAPRELQDRYRGSAGFWAHPRPCQSFADYGKCSAVRYVRDYHSCLDDGFICGSNARQALSYFLGFVASAAGLDWQHSSTYF